MLTFSKKPGEDCLFFLWLDDSGDHENGRKDLLAYTLGWRRGWGFQGECRRSRHVSVVSEEISDGPSLTLGNRNWVERC